MLTTAPQCQPYKKVTRAKRHCNHKIVLRANCTDQHLFVFSLVPAVKQRSLLLSQELRRACGRSVPKRTLLLLQHAALHLMAQIFNHIHCVLRTLVHHSGEQANQMVVAGGKKVNFTEFWGDIVVNGIVILWR